MMGAVLILLWGSQALAACPDAETARTQDAWAEVLLAADACLAMDADDVEAQTLRYLALARTDQLSAALAQIKAVLERYPDDVDHRGWQVRLLAWLGDLKEAQRKLDALPAGSLDDPDLRGLAGDVALWDERYTVAAEHYRQLLAVRDDAETHRKLGLALAGEGQLEAAQIEAQTACERGDAAGCADVDNLRRQRARSAVSVSPGVFVDAEGLAGAQLVVDGQHQAWRSLAVGAGVDLRERRFDTETLNDVYLEGRLGWGPRRGLHADAAVGGTVQPDFSPVFAVKLSAGYRADPVDLSVGYWRLQFDTGGAHVVTPQLSVSAAKWQVDGRYFLTLDDSGDVAHAGYAKLSRTTEPLGGYFGVGAGNRTDFLFITDRQADRAVQVLGGVSWRSSWRLRTRLDYTLRLENSGTESYTLHQVSLGQEVRF